MQEAHIRLPPRTSTTTRGRRQRVARGTEKQGVSEGMEREREAARESGWGSGLVDLELFCFFSPEMSHRRRVWSSEAETTRSSLGWKEADMT